MLSRRHFLRFAGLSAGGAYFTTFLNQLNADDTASQPMRVLFFLQANGVLPDQVQPIGIERAKDADAFADRPLKDHTLPDPIAPLEPFKHRLAILQGLSGGHLKANHSTEFSCLGCYPWNKGILGETIDWSLSKRLPAIFPHVGLGTHAEPHTNIIYNVSASDRDKALPTVCQPLSAYRRLFGAALGGDARQAIATRANVLDHLAGDVRRLERQLNVREKEKLGHYLHAFESMTAQQTALGRIADRIAKAMPQPSKNYEPDIHWMDRLEAQFEIAAGALIAGITNVVTVSSNSGLQAELGSIDGTQLGLEAGPINLHGDVGHGRGFGGKSSGELHGLIRKKHMEHLARFLAKLDSIPEGQGTMLDNSLVVYTSDYGHNHHSDCKEWPFLLVGDLGGRLNTRGRYLNFPYYANQGGRTTANLYTTLLHVVGDQRKRFGFADPNLKHLNQDGPLDELLA